VISIDEMSLQYLHGVLSSNFVDIQSLSPRTFDFSGTSWRIMGGRKRNISEAMGRLFCDVYSKSIEKACVNNVEVYIPRRRAGGPIDF